MVSPVDAWFSNHDEPVTSCLLFLRNHILKFDPDITEKWSYGMPFFSYQGKRICYLWVHKKYKLPYIGFVDGNLIYHPDLLKEDRSRMKIMLIDPMTDGPVELINSLLREAINLKT